MADHHGNSPAAWTGVVLSLVGFTIGGIGMLLAPNYILFWIGVILQPIALVAFKTMSVAAARTSHDAAARG